MSIFDLPRSILISVWNKSCKENQNIFFVQEFFFSKFLLFVRKRWENFVERDMPQVAIWRMRIASWIPKATNKHTHTSCVTLIAFPLQRWMHERASLLRYTYIARLVFIALFIAHFNRFVILSRNVFTIYVTTYHIFVKKYRLPVSYWGYLKYSQDLRNVIRTIIKF